MVVRGGQPGREPKGKGRASSRFAFDREISPHELGKVAGDGQSQPRPSEAVFDGCVGLGKGFEYPGSLFGGHSDAGVGDGDREMVQTDGIGLRRKDDVTMIGKFSGIFKEIDEDLAQPSPVGDHRGGEGGRSDKEPVAGGLDGGKDHVGGFFDQLFERKGFRVEQKLAVPDLGHVEEVVDESLEVAGGGQGLLHISSGLGVRIAPREDQLAIAHDGVQRGPELVAHAGEKLLSGLFPQKDRLVAPEGGRNDKEQDDHESGGKDRDRLVVAHEDPVCLNLPLLGPQGPSQENRQPDHPAFDGRSDDLPAGGFSLGIGGVGKKGEKCSIDRSHFGSERAGAPADIRHGGHGLDPIGPKEGDAGRSQGRVAIFFHDGEACENGFRIREGPGDLLLKLKIVLREASVLEKGSASGQQNQGEGHDNEKARAESFLGVAGRG